MVMGTVRRRRDLAARSTGCKFLVFHQTRAGRLAYQSPSLGPSGVFVRFGPGSLAPLQVRRCFGDWTGLALVLAPSEFSPNFWDSWFWRTGDDARRST